MTNENKPQISEEEKKKREKNIGMINKLSDLAVAGSINHQQDTWGKQINESVKNYVLEKYAQDNGAVPAEVIEYAKAQIMQGQQDRGEQIHEPENIPLETIVMAATGLHGQHISQLSINELAGLAGWKNENPKYSEQKIADLMKSKDEKDKEMAHFLTSIYLQNSSAKTAADSLAEYSKKIFKASGIEEFLKKPEKSEAPVSAKPKSDDPKSVEKQKNLEKEREIALKFTKGDFTDWAYSGLIAESKDYGKHVAQMARMDSIQKAKDRDLSGRLFVGGLENTGISGTVYQETFSYARAGSGASETFSHYLEKLKVDDVVAMTGLKNENPKYAGAYISELLEGKDEEGKMFAQALVENYKNYVTAKKASESLSNSVKLTNEKVVQQYLSKPKEEKEKKE